MAGFMVSLSPWGIRLHKFVISRVSEKQQGFGWPGLGRGGTGHSEGQRSPGRSDRSSGFQTRLHSKPGLVSPSDQRNQNLCRKIVLLLNLPPELRTTGLEHLLGLLKVIVGPVHSMCVYTRCLLKQKGA